MKTKNEKIYQYKVQQFEETKEKVKILREGLIEIIDLCPEPKLPYGNQVVEAAKQALRKAGA